MTYLTRGCGIIRDRCEQFITELKERGYDNCIPLEKAKELFTEILGIYDRTSLKAYFGSVPGRSDRKILRWARYLKTGTTSPKEIVLSQDIPKRVGYLEKLQLVCYEQRGGIREEETGKRTAKVWFMVLKNPVLVPQLMKARVSMENISLTLKLHENPIARSLSGSPRERSCSVETTNNNNNFRMREKSFFPMQNITDMPLSIYGMPRSIPDMHGKQEVKNS